MPRISDLPFVLPSLLGKVEFETMEEGREDKIVARLVNEAVRTVFDKHARAVDLDDVVAAFDGGVTVEVGDSLGAAVYRDLVGRLNGLERALAVLVPDATPGVRAATVEFLLEGLHLNKRLNKNQVRGQIRYRA